MSDEDKKYYYDRKWKITVTAQDASTWTVTNEDKNPLRCTFKNKKLMLVQYWSCEVTFWNLDAETGAKVIKEGDHVDIEAGYKDGPYGHIWSGNVFQATWDRENVTDYKITLYCLDGFGLLDSNMTNLTLAAGYNYRDVITAMWTNSHTPIPIGEVTDSLDKKTAPRGKTCFMDPNTITRRIEQDNNAHAFMKDGRWNLAAIDDAYNKEALIVGPDRGLIGSPWQTQYGVYFRCLLNPDIMIQSPPMVVQIKPGTAIQQMKTTPGGALPAVLDKEGFYKVVGTIYTGDTRGDDWYVDVIGINLVGKVSALFQKFSR